MLIELKAAAVGKPDEIVRTGGPDVGTVPRTALGAEGVISAVGGAVGNVDECLGALKAAVSESAPTLI